MFRIIVDLNDQTAGTCRNAGLGKRRNEIPDSGSMTRIDNDRIMRQLLKYGNRTELIRAVVEGTCMHLRWFLETEDKKTKTSDVLRFVGGGALSDVTSQILADCTGRTVEVVASPQNVGAVGAAVISAVGLGMIGSIEEAKKLVPAKKTFIPNPSLKPIYDKNFAVFKNLYKSNKENFAALNG